MPQWVTYPSFWASVGVILTTLGVNLPQELWGHIVEAIAAIAGIVGIITAARS